MNALNHITSAIFDVLMAPWGHGVPLVDLSLWSILAAVLALVVYKRVSNQEGIARTKDKIKMHLMEIRLWRHDLGLVFASMARILGNNAIYIAFNLVPMFVLGPPMMVVLFQLEANFSHAPSPVGTVNTLRVTLTEGTEAKVTDITLELPPGVLLDAPPVRTPDREAFWRLRALAPGDHVLILRAGEQTLSKGWAVGGEHRKVPIKRTRSLEALLYPGEAGIPADSPFYSAELTYPERDFPFLPDGEMGILVIFMIISLVAAYSLKGVFGVSL